jgi:hypothetical protein
MDEGSSDFAGVIVLNTGTAGTAMSGSINLTFNVPYNGISPVIVACLIDGLTGWSDVGAQAKVVS